MSESDEVVEIDAAEVELDEAALADKAAEERAAAAEAADAAAVAIAQSELVKGLELAREWVDNHRDELGDPRVREGLVLIGGLLQAIGRADDPAEAFAPMSPFPRLAGIRARAAVARSGQERAAIDFDELRDFFGIMLATARVADVL